MYAKFSIAVQTKRAEARVIIKTEGATGPLMSLLQHVRKSHSRHETANYTKRAFLQQQRYLIIRTRLFYCGT
jgi:hypothetical protein